MQRSNDSAKASTLSYCHISVPVRALRYSTHENLLVSEIRSLLVLCLLGGPRGATQMLSFEENEPLVWTPRMCVFGETYG